MRSREVGASERDHGCRVAGATPPGHVFDLHSDLLRRKTPDASRSRVAYKPTGRSLPMPRHYECAPWIGTPPHFATAPYSGAPGFDRFLRKRWSRRAVWSQRFELLQLHFAVKYRGFDTSEADHSGKAGAYADWNWVDSARGRPAPSEAVRGGRSARVARHVDSMARASRVVPVMRVFKNCSFLRRSSSRCSRVRACGTYGS